MEKIYYTDASRFSSSTEAVKHILDEHFALPNAELYRTETGKPYLNTTSERLFFSVSHTKTHLFVAFCDENVGIDAEKIDRSVNYPLLAKRFPIEEQTEISSCEAFLRHWTVKESAVKWLGGTLAHDLNRLAYIKERLSYENLDIPVYVTTLSVAGHVLSVCSERDFTHAQLILL